VAFLREHIQVWGEERYIPEFNEVFGGMTPRRIQSMHNNFTTQYQILTLVKAILNVFI
jgi:hypothetical protein